jgi:hypothetical protein
MWVWYRSRRIGVDVCQEISMPELRKYLSGTRVPTEMSKMSISEREKNEVGVLMMSSRRRNSGKIPDPIWQMGTNIMVTLTARINQIYEVAKET